MKDHKEEQLKKFEKQLDEEWRFAMMSSTTDEVNTKIREVAMEYVRLDLGQKLDPDIISMKEKLRFANASYVEGKKVARTRIEFLMETLAARGEDVPSIQDFLREAESE